MSIVSDRITLILVAEDDDTLRYLTQRQLSALGYQCDTVANGEDALKRALERKYDIILMDVQMPIMNGLEACRAIRRHESECEDDEYTPIVAMTANPKREQCFEAGMNDFIFKPISLQQIKQALDRWVA
jgi:CheY-like chemotaxis protein